MIKTEEMLRLGEKYVSPGPRGSGSDGGPAFARSGDRAIPGAKPQEGMSLRDWFAGQALLAKHGTWANSDAPVLAKWAYAMADAMLAARAQGGNDE